jgi:hypothetical protein
MGTNSTLFLTIPQGIKESNDSYYLPRGDVENDDVPTGASIIPLQEKY